MQIRNTSALKNVARSSNKNRSHRLSVGGVRIYNKFSPETVGATPKGVRTYDGALVAMRSLRGEK